jgi:FtsZ-binding cell division protein ZapB
MELQHIQSKIYEIRGYRVILDRDLAFMYGVTTANLNKAVKRNIGRFPDDFMFQLNTDEFHLIFQNGTSSWGGTRKLPYAFTEHGVAMLSGLLNSPTAIEMNIQIVRAFVALRQIVMNTPIDRVTELQRNVRELKEYIEDVFADQSNINEDTRTQLETINQALVELQTQKQATEKPRRRVGFIPYDDEEN